MSATTLFAVVALFAILATVVAVVVLLAERRIEDDEFAAQIDGMLPRIDGGVR